MGEFIAQRFGASDHDGHGVAEQSITGAAASACGAAGLEGLFKAAFESAPCGMVLTAQSGAILLVNDYLCQLLGWTVDELVGRPIEDLVPHAHRPRHVQHRNGFFQNSSKRMMAAGRDLSAQRRDGTVIPVEILLSPVELQQGRAVICAVVDLTQRKRAEAELRQHAEELEQRNKTLDEFTYLVSHDLKAPLRAISLVADWLLADHRDGLGAEGCQHLETIRQRIARMNQLIQGALTYAKAGRDSGEPEHLSSGEVLAEIVDMLDIPGQATVVATSDLPEIHYQRDHFAKILMNLIANALAYSGRPDARVEVSCAEGDREFVFTVRDNGPGIHAQHHDRIFRMFQRLPNSGGDSTGVGLAIVKTLVDRHGGRVWLESAPGQGSAFHFTIPQVGARRALVYTS